MIEINLNVKTVDLNNKPLGNQTMGESLANILVGGVKGEALKFYDWAVALNKNEKISVDESDFKKIYLFVEESDVISILLKAQLLRQLDACKASASDLKKK